MNYYERYCGDYQRDTAHLSLAEHGAYTMLLDTYFSVEKPLPEDLPSLYRVCRAMTRPEQQAVKGVAAQFFPVCEIDGLRHNRRADREIAKARQKIETARSNGRKGGRPPRDASQSAWSETQDIPDGFSAGSSGAAAEISAGKPGGKAYQPQLQHQFQPQLQPQRHAGKSEASTCASSEEQACVPDPMPDFVSRLVPGTSANSPDSLEAKTLPAAGASGADRCCKTLVRHGVQGCNPHHPTLLALLRAGAVEDEFVQAARNASAKGKANFAYVLGTVKRQREDAAKLVLHQGRMPGRQELLESSNRAATEGWLPPELRQAETGEPQRKEAGHAN